MEKSLVPILPTDKAEKKVVFLRDNDHSHVGIASFVEGEEVGTLWFGIVPKGKEGRVSTDAQKHLNDPRVNAVGRIVRF